VGRTPHRGGRPTAFPASSGGPRREGSRLDPPYDLPATVS